MPVRALILLLFLACSAAAQGTDDYFHSVPARPQAASQARPRVGSGTLTGYKLSLSPLPRRFDARFLPPISASAWLDDPAPLGGARGAGLADEAAPEPIRSTTTPSFEWRSALWESFRFLMIEHGFRMAFQEPARRHTVKGNFWNDYVRSVKRLEGWEDENGFLVNYVGHPLQGSTTGFIFIQNHAEGRNLSFENSRPYWTSRLKSMAWSAAYSTYFEIGFPFSEAALGNVGSPKRRSKMGYVDLVVTPTLGTALLVGEDAVDKYLVRRLEGMSCNRLWRATVRGFLNPSRAMANIVRGRHAWHRDTRPGITECKR